MKKLIQILLLLLPLLAFGQTPRVFTGKCNISQTGSGSGYWTVAVTNLSDPGGLYDATEITVGDKLLFSDGGILYKLPITLVASAVGNSATIRVSNVGVTGISSVPTYSGATITRGTPNHGLIPFTANISDNNQQLQNEHNEYLIDSLLSSGIDTSYTRNDSVFVLADGIEYYTGTQDMTKSVAFTEIAASDIPTGTKQALGFMVQFKSGKIAYIYPDGGVAMSRGDLAMRISVDGGRNFGSETDIVRDTLLDISNIGGGVTSTGRLIVHYRKESATTGEKLGIGRKYSDDEGVTWSSELLLADTIESPYGGIIDIGNSKILLPFYLQNPTPSRVAGTYVMLSSDNGETFGSPILVLAGGSNSEATYAYLGGSYIVGIVRKDNGSTFRQVLSSDNGETWVDQGDTNFETWTAGTNIESPAWLVTWRRTGGKKGVSCYYVNRETRKMRTIVANSEDIIFLGVSAWQTATMKTIENATATSGYGCGYPSAIHPFDSPYGIGWFYDTNTGLSTTYINSFTSTAAYQYPSGQILFGNGYDPTSTNYLTMSDSAIIINGIKVWKGQNSKDENTAVGENTLNSNTTGLESTAIGYGVLKSNTTGYSNTGIGRVALENNTTGYSNTAAGSGGLRINTTGYNNTAVGEAALRYNTTGYANVAIGKNALYLNDSGSSNIAIGQNAGYWGTAKKNTIHIAFGLTADAGLQDSTAIIGRAMKWVRLGDNYKFNTDQTLGAPQANVPFTFNNLTSEIESATSTVVIPAGMEVTGNIDLNGTIITGGTTGDQTINKSSGCVNFAAASTALTVTNSLVTSSSLVNAWVNTNDATAYVKNVVPGSGSFIINLGAAATAETKVCFLVINP